MESKKRVAADEALHAAKVQRAIDAVRSRWDLPPYQSPKHPAWLPPNYSPKWASPTSTPTSTPPTSRPSSPTSPPNASVAKIASGVFGTYKDSDRLPETNGYFSLNFTPGSVMRLSSLLKLEGARSVYWVGCGTAPELISLAIFYPSVRFLGVDPNHLAIEVARAKAQKLGCKNTEFLCNDAMHMGQNAGKFDRVFSAANATSELYTFLYYFAAGARICLVDFGSVTHKEICRMRGASSESLVVQGSGETKTACAADLPIYLPGDTQYWSSFRPPPPLQYGVAKRVRKPVQRYTAQ